MAKRSSQKDADRQKTEYDFSREKAGLVENMPIRTPEKVEILLVMAGAKSATGVELIGTECNEGTEPEHISPDKLREIAESLKKLGLSFSVKKPFINKYIRVENDDIPRDEIKPEDEEHFVREIIEIEIARNDRLLGELLKAVESENHIKMGDLYGFPKTAVAEFLKEDQEEESNMISRADLPEDLKREDWSHFINFKLSRENWREEIKTAHRWAEIVRKMSPEIYSEHLEFMKDVV